MIVKFKDFVPEIDESCFIAPGSVVAGNVKLGKNVSVWYNAVIRGDIERIIIGDDTNIQDCCVLHCINGIELVVGNGVVVGHGAVLHSCTIGDGSLIGMGSIILDGVKVGKNCLIAAGSVVTPKTIIPDGSLVMGNPGIVKRQLTKEVIAHIGKGKEEYLRLAEIYKSETEKG